MYLQKYGEPIPALFATSIGSAITNGKNTVFYVPQSLKLFGAELLRWNLMKQILKPSEWAKEATNKSSEHYAEKNQYASYIV